jgi:hypothetical protein
VIDAELGSEDHGLIPVTTIGRGLKPLMSELTSEPDSTGGEKKIKQIHFKINYKINIRRNHPSTYLT